MRILGFLFVLLLVVGAVGFWRGWFTLRTANAGDHDTVQLEVDRDRIDRDTQGVKDKIGGLSQRTVDKVRSVARDTTTDQKVVEGNVAKVDVTGRDITVMSANQEIDVTVPRTVEIRRAGHDVPLGELAAGHRVSMTFQVQGETWRLQRIDLLS